MVVLIQCSTLDELGSLKPIGYVVLNLFENFLINYGNYERNLIVPPITLIQTENSKN